MHESQPTPTGWQIAAAMGALYLIWGSTYLAIRISLETLPPLLMAGVRFVVAGTLLYGWMRFRGADRPEPAHWKSAAVIGGFLLLGGNGGVCWAEQRVPSGLTALLIGTTPLWMTLLDWLWHGAAKPTPRMVFGLVCGFAGVALLISPGKFGGGGRVDPIGAAVLMGATLAWATGSLYTRRARLPASPLLATAMEMLTGGVMLLLAGFVTQEWGRFAGTQVSTRSVLAVVYLIVFGSLIAFSAYIWLLGVTTIARASTYAFVNPLLAVFLGWALADEPVSLRTLLAAAAIIAAVAVIISHPSTPSTNAR